MLAQPDRARRAAGQQALVLLGAACVLCGLVAWGSHVQAPTFSRAAPLALYVPPAGLRTAAVPRPQTVPVAPSATYPGSQIPAAPVARVTPHSVMLETPADSPGAQMPAGQLLPLAVKQTEKEAFLAPMQILFWSLAASLAMGMTIMRKRIYDSMTTHLDGADDSVELGNLPAPANAFQAVVHSDRVGRAGVPTMMAGSADEKSLEDLQKLAVRLNPAVGFFDPIGLSNSSIFDYSVAETNGWIRHAEIKHGRVAMAAFVGYVIGANNIRFPWDTKVPLDVLTPPEQWDALPEAARWQIILGVGFLEWWSELRLVPGEKHYMKGGKPGYVPAFDATPTELPHWIGLNLWDPFKFTQKLTEEQKQRGLEKEINNGRLAMLGIMGFLSEAKIPGSVPLLKGVVAPYAGEVMNPFPEIWNF